jgi:hypothetical protein
MFEELNKKYPMTKPLYASQVKKEMDFNKTFAAYLAQVKSKMHKSQHITNKPPS